MGRNSRRRRQMAERNSPTAKSERRAQVSRAGRAKYNKRRFGIDSKWLWTGGVGTVVAIFIVVIFILESTLPTPQSAAGKPAPAYLTSALIAQKVSNFAKVGEGSISTYPTAITKTGYKDLDPQGSTKPWLFYAGAEYCPYCAAERWSMAIALEQFGTLKGLYVVRSSASDTDPNTPTLSFYKSTYKSKYINFYSVEETTNQINAAGTGYQILQKPNAKEASILEALDSCSSCGIPFMDFNNEYTNNVNYNPAVFQGLNWKDVVKDLKNQKSSVAQGIFGTANLLTAGICKMDGNMPGKVCNNKTIKTIEASRWVGGVTSKNISTSKLPIK